MHRRRVKHNLIINMGGTSHNIFKDAYDLKDAIKQRFFSGAIVVRNQIVSGVYLGGRLVWVDVMDAGHSDIYRLRRKL